MAIDLLGRDVVTFARCVALDAEVFPYPSADFRLLSWRDRIWVARESDSGRVVGFLASRAQRGRLHVQGLATDPSSRRRGVGRALVRACLDSDLAGHAEAVALTVSVTNQGAICLYESEGFTIVRRMPDYYRPGTYGSQCDAFVMERSSPSRNPTGASRSRRTR